MDRNYNSKAIQYSLAWHLTDWPAEMGPTEILSFLRSGDYVRALCKKNPALSFVLGVDNDEMISWDQDAYGSGSDVADSIEEMAFSLTDWFDLPR